MTEVLLILILILCVLISILLIFKKKDESSKKLILEVEASLLRTEASLFKAEASIQRTELMQEQLQKSVKDDFQRSREEDSKQFSQNRLEMSNSLESFEKRLETVRETIERRLKDLQLDNSKKLEEMRKTVDEKLQETLNKRISESFKLVSENLEKVQKGLGEMSELASGVGDLKKVLQNVKTRGVMGEVQLGAILEQFLSPEQYVSNVKIKDGTTESVEFAVCLPGKDDQDKEVLLPIDSKFPMEDYIRLQEIYEKVDEYTKEDILRAENQFAAIVKKSAKLISDKYINPPKTTNFAIMFVPTEGLYSQILRQTGLFELLQHDYKITVVGPSNLVAFLSSLQMGFKTLAVQKHSSEVWNVLAAVKTEFGKFELVLSKAQRQMNQASDSLDELVGKRTRSIQRKLREVGDKQDEIDDSDEIPGLPSSED